MKNTKKKVYTLTEETMGFSSDLTFNSLSDAEKELENIAEDYRHNVDAYNCVKKYGKKIGLNVDDKSWKYAEHWIVWENNEFAKEVWINREHFANRTTKVTISDKPFYGNYRIK